jgi:HPt (histidine-containing phosphotransfer) domain-containing protein
MSDQTADSEPPVDLSCLRAITDGDADADREMSVLFAMQGDANIQALQDNCRGGSHRNWAETAHMLKGSAANMGANILAKLCDEAQHIADSADARGVFLAKIEREYLAVKEFLRSKGLLV